MTVFFEFLLIGLASGGLLSLLAVGIVVIHRASHAINFAQSAFAMVGAYVFYYVHVSLQLPFVTGLLLAMAISTIVSLASYLLIMRPLRNAPAVSTVIGTLAIFEFIDQAMSHIVSPNTLLVPSSLPTTVIHIAGTTMGENSLIAFGIALAIAIVLYLGYKYSQLGRATTAALDNTVALRSLGLSAEMISAINWAIGGCLAGVAGVFMAPLVGLSISSFSLLILPALAAAVLGQFYSIPWAVVGALVIGIAQSEVSFYTSITGLGEAIPFVVIILVLLWRGVGSTSRSALVSRLPKVGTGIIRPGRIIAIMVVALVAIYFVHNDVWLGAITVTIGSATVLLSFVIITGYTGQLSLAQFGIAGLGAWISGVLLVHAHIPLLFAVAIGVLVLVPFGLLVGRVCLRTSGVSLAILTLGLSVVLEYMLFQSDILIGTGGLDIGNINLFGWSVYAGTHPTRYAMVVLVLFCGAAIVTANLRRGTIGLRFLATRANERAARSLGVDTGSARTLAFGLASAIAGLGGVILGFGTAVVPFNSFSALSSVEAVPQAVIGGLGWIAGPVLGALGSVGGLIQVALTEPFGSTVGNYVPLGFAILLLIVITTNPDGAALVLVTQARWVVRAIRGERGEVGSDVVAPMAVVARPTRRSDSAARLEGSVSDGKNSKLHLENLTVAFGNVIAADSVSLQVSPGEIVGLIGPNGAGKTTVIDGISGNVKCRSGAIMFGEEDLGGLGVAARSRRGVVRSFQSLELFEDLSVADNLRVAGTGASKKKYLMDLVRPRPPEFDEGALNAIAAFGLQPVLDAFPGSIPYSSRRTVAIARAVSTMPRVLLLDEPASGLDEDEVDRLTSLIKELAQSWDMGILLVEHDVEMVMSVCERIYVMELGKVIAHGTANEIIQNPRVVDAYLGTSSGIDEQSSNASESDALTEKG